MKLFDIEQASGALKSLDPESIVVMDIIFMERIFQSPLELGADIVMDSLTKYINRPSQTLLRVH